MCVLRETSFQWPVRGPTCASANPLTKSDFKWEGSPFTGLSTDEIEALGEIIYP